MSQQLQFLQNLIQRSKFVMQAKTTRSSTKKTSVTKTTASIGVVEPKGKRAKFLSANKDPSPQKKIKTSDSIDVKTGKKTKEQSKSLAKTNSKIDIDAKNQQAKSLEKQKGKEPAKQPAKIQQDEKKQTKVVLKGSIPVDPHVEQKNVKVLVHDGVTYAATLNQTNVQNNNNKFYIIQILQSESNSNNYYFFTRWGRVGVVGQKSQAGPWTRDQCIRQYHNKMNAKTKAGDYRIVEMNYEAEQKEQKKPQAKKQQEKKQQVQSSLDKKVQDLMRLIFDMKMIDNQMKQIGYDSSKMPLGKLAKSSIMKGYEALKKLMQEVKGKKRKDIIAQHSNDFYSYIPHDFGFKQMSNFILDSESKIRAKLQMLQSLEDIQVFTKLLDEGKIANDMNQIDSNYLKLNTQIKPLSKESQEFKIIEKYVKNTHATTHTSYRLEIEEVFTLRKDVEEARYRKDIHNKQLLWHGSRLTNYVGILSQGLRIAPPEAPVTGYMFGKGVYFADMVSKSANYCFTNKNNNTGLMLLCQVALGNCNQKFYADYYANLLPDNKHSTKGCGKTAPLQGENLGDVFVPNGVGKTVNIAQGSLLYNEFIVYDVAQIRSKYLLRMKFVY